MTFPGIDPPAPKPEHESRGQRRTREARNMIARGRHPFGRAQAGNGKTCGECWFAVQADGGRRSYWKCERNRLSRSEATDLRLGWPACDLFTPTQPAGYETTVPAWVPRRGS